MENSKGRPKASKPDRASAADLRQMDLWNRAAADAAQAAASNPAPASGAPAHSTASSKPPRVADGAKPAAPAAVRAVNEPRTIAAPAAPTGSRASAPAAPTANRPAPRAAPATLSAASRARSAPAAAVLAPPRSLPALTRRQHELIDYLAEREQNGLRAPSLTEICRDLGLVSRGSLHKQISALVEARLVEPMNGKQRGVRLQRASNDETRLPLLGAIAAGAPIEALTRDESVVVPGWLRTGGDCYALRVRGDSMRDVGILDGDIVVIESRQTARNGELVVALVDESETTLKRIEQKPGEVLLHAENPAYGPQRYVPDRVKIQGVVVGSIRRY